MGTEEVRESGEIFLSDSYTSSSASILSAPSASYASLAFLAVTRGDEERRGIAVKIMGQCGDGESDGGKDGGIWLSLILRRL